MKNIVFWAFFLIALGTPLTSKSTKAANWNTGGSGSTTVIPQTDPGGPAVNHTRGAELPQNIRPNDNTISLYQNKRVEFIRKRHSQGRLYTVKPAGNASEFKFASNDESKILEQELSEGYILSYLFYEDGTVKYDGRAKSGRFEQDVNNQLLFYTHSTGKSITSYIIGHAICDGYIGSIDELIDWPMMHKTIYQGQSLLDLLNMRAGDKHTIDEEKSHYVMGSKKHHRDMGLNEIAKLLEGTKKQGRNLFYNNFLTDVLANYVAFKSGDKYDDLMRKVFQEKVKIAYPIAYEKHVSSKGGSTKDKNSPDYFGQPQTLASYSFFMTRMDFLRVAKAMMEDYQNGTCVGNYLKQIQSKAEPWYRGRDKSSKARLYLNNYAQKYGGQFYFDFIGMKQRNIFGTEGYNGQNMLIDMDNSRIVVTNSAATAWDQRTFMLEVIRDGKLPKEEFIAEPQKNRKTNDSEEVKQAGVQASGLDGNSFSTIPDLLTASAPSPTARKLDRSKPSLRQRFACLKKSFETNGLSGFPAPDEVEEFINKLSEYTFISSSSVKAGTNTETLSRFQLLRLGLPRSFADKYKRLLLALVNFEGDAAQYCQSQKNLSK